MPKQRITKDMVVEVAFEIARRSGMEGVMVKNIARELGCSVQPIYSYCTNMEGLREAVGHKARSFIGAYLASHIDKRDPFRSTGRAYIQLAQEEPHLLKIFLMQERKNVTSLKDLYEAEADPQMAQAVAQALDLSVACARQLHLHMLIYTIGLGTVFSVSSPGIPIDEIFSQQDQAYQIFMNYALRKKGPCNENSSDL